MPNPIRPEDLIDAQGFKKTLEGMIAEFNKASNAIIEDVKKIKKETQNIKLTDEKAAEKLAAQDAALKKNKENLTVLGAAKRDLIALEKQEVATKAKLITANSKQAKATRQVKVALQEANRTLNQAAKLTTAQEGSMKQLSLQLGQNRERYRRLSEAERENVQVGGVLLSTIQRQDAEIKRLDATIGNSQRNVGNYAAAIIEAERALRAEKAELEANTRALKIASKQTNRNKTDQDKIQKELRETEQKYKQVNIQLNQFNIQQNNSVTAFSSTVSGLRSVAGALGLLGGATLIVRGFRDLLGVFTGFELAAAKVRAISGATDEEFKLLTGDAKALGESTEQTASAVAGLQLQLAKLGFTTGQILDATGAILNLATAADEDLGESARVVGNTLRAFGLEASEATRLTDIMAAAFTGSALDLSKFSVAMASVAPVARTFGFSVEETTALLAQLANAGFDASSAGTATRNILLNLADANGKLAQELGRPVKTLPDLVAGLKELDARGINLGETLELTDKRSVAAFNTFIQGADSALVLSESLKNSAGSASAMADIMRDTLSGDTDKARSAVEGLAIRIGEFLQPALRLIVQGFTAFISNIGTVINVVKVAAAGLLAYAVVTRGSAVAQRAYTIAVNLARAANIAFSASLTATPWGLIAGLIAAAVAAVVIFRDEIFSTTKALDEFSGKHKVFLEELSNEEAQLRTLFDAAKNAKEGTEQRGVAIDELNRLYGDYLPNLLTEKSTLQEIEAAQELANRELVKNIAIKSKQNEITEANTRLLTAQRNAQRLVTVENAEFQRTVTAGFNDLIASANAGGLAITNFGDDVAVTFSEQTNREIFEFAKQFEGVGVSFADLRGALTDIVIAQRDASASIAETTDFYDQFIDSLGLSNKASEQAVVTGNGISKVTRDLIKLKQEEIKATQDVEAGTKAELAVRNLKVAALQAELRILQNLGDQEEEIQKARTALRDIEVQNIESELRREENAAFDRINRKRAALEAERDLLIKQGGDEAIIRQTFNKLIEELELQSERDIAQKRADIRIQANEELHDKELKQTETLLLNQGFTRAEIDAQLRDERIAALEEEIDLRLSLQQDATDQELELAKLQTQQLKEEADKRKEIFKELTDIAIQGIQLAVQANSRKADKAVEDANKELAATEVQVSRQEELARQGLDNTLKFEQENRAKALQAKLDAEEKKQRAEKITAFWNLVANSDNVLQAIGKFGVGEAFARTIDIIPAFKDGGETPGKPTLAMVGEKGKEWVSTADTYKKYAPELMAMHDGTYDKMVQDNTLQSTIPVFKTETSTNTMSTSKLEAKLEQLGNRFDAAIPKFEGYFDQTKQQMIDVLKFGNKKKIIRYNAPR